MRALVLVNAMHIIASAFINDDEYGLHQDYERWLEEVCSGLHPAPQRRSATAGPPTGRLHNRTGEDKLMRT